MNLSPRYYRYHGGWWTVTKCSECGCVGLYEDAHPARPCFNCGGKVEEAGAGKWHEPVYKGFFWKKLIKKGYWELKEE